MLCYCFWVASIVAKAVEGGWRGGRLLRGAVLLKAGEAAQPHPVVEVRLCGILG